MLKVNRQVKKAATAMVLGAGALAASSTHVRAAGNCYDYYCSGSIPIGSALTTVPYECQDPMPEGDALYYCNIACNTDCADMGTSCDSYYYNPWGGQSTSWGGNFQYCENNTLHCDCWNFPY